MSGILSADDLAAIRERVEAATPGPWEREHGIVWGDGGRQKVVYSGALTHDVDTLEFVTAARTDLPALLASHEALRRLAAELAVTLQERTCCSVDWPHSSALLAKARAAGLLGEQA